MVNLGKLAVGRLDLSLIRIMGDAQYLIVVLRLGAFECNLRLLNEGVNDV